MLTPSNDQSIYQQKDKSANSLSKGNIIEDELLKFVSGKSSSLVLLANVSIRALTGFVEAFRQLP